MILDQQRRNLLVTNCIGGSVAVLPVAADGKLGAATQLVQHPGTKPHTHGITLSPDNRFAYACDMGLDRLMAYQFDAAKGKLTPAAVAHHRRQGGHRPPAHGVRARRASFAYVVGSKNSTITVFAFDGKTGGLKEVQTVKTVPQWFDGSNTAAELAVHPSANYLYVCNRGHNSVVMFTIDPGKGTLTYLEDQDTGGKTPRHFALDAGAKHLVGRQPGVRHRAGLPHRRRQRPAEAVGRVDAGAVADGGRLPAAALTAIEQSRRRPGNQ